MWYDKDGKLLCGDILGQPNTVWIPKMRKVEELLKDTAYKRVAKTTLSDGKWISTVWLGLDHNFGGSGKPIIFETMVFPSIGNYSELDCVRYSTLEEAQKGHKKMVAKWKRKIKK